MKPETKKAAKARLIAEKQQAKEAAIFRRLKEIFEHPVGVVIAPLKGEAISRAVQEAKACVENIRKKLDEAGNDLNKVAPYPASRTFKGSQMEWMGAYFKNKLYASVTKWRQGSRSSRDPVLLVDVCPVMVKKFIEDAKQDAADQFTAFVAKLVTKIGPCKSASLEGNYVWSHSILTVVLPDGSTQKWKTQQIVNISKHGKVFNQWPSRIIK